jgi:hypothetical protein
MTKLDPLLALILFSTGTVSSPSSSILLAIISSLSQWSKLLGEQIYWVSRLALILSSIGTVSSSSSSPLLAIFSSLSQWSKLLREQMYWVSSSYCSFRVYSISFLSELSWQSRSLLSFVIISFNQSSLFLSWTSTCLTSSTKLLILDKSFDFELIGDILSERSELDWWEGEWNFDSFFSSAFHSLFFQMLCYALSLMLSFFLRKLFAMGGLVAFQASDSEWASMLSTSTDTSAIWSNLVLGFSFVLLRLISLHGAITLSLYFS